MRAYLYAQGFQRVLALHPQVCGLESADATLWLCLWGYQAAQSVERTQGEIHPYYPASQRAYLGRPPGGGGGGEARAAPATGYRASTETALCPSAGIFPGTQHALQRGGHGQPIPCASSVDERGGGGIRRRAVGGCSHGLSCGACQGMPCRPAPQGPWMRKASTGSAACATGCSAAGRFRRKCGPPWETCLWGAMPASDAVPKTQACRGDPAQALRWITCCAHPRMPHNIWRRRLASTWQSQTESWDRHCLLRATVETKHCCHW